MIIDTFNKIKDLASEVCSQNGCKLYDIDFQSGSKGKGRRLLVYVDKTNGVSLEDCEKVSRALSDLLDADDNLMPDADYILEVSSPGLEKPLKQKWHFESVVGKQIFVQSKESLNGQQSEIKRFKVSGILESVSDHNILVTAEGKSFNVPIDQIKKSHLIFNYNELKDNKKN